MGIVQILLDKPFKTGVVLYILGFKIALIIEVMLEIRLKLVFSAQRAWSIFRFVDIRRCGSSSNSIPSEELLGLNHRFSMKVLNHTSFVGLLFRFVTILTFISLGLLSLIFFNFITTFFLRIKLLTLQSFHC